MIRSMTGFGRAERSDENVRISAEIRSVNHRYLDLSVRMPRKLFSLEGQVRTLVKERIRRGKVDIFISYEDLSRQSQTVHYNETIAGEYMKHLTSIAETFGLDKEVHLTSLARFPEILTMEEAASDDTLLWQELSPVLNEALDRFVQSRIREGTALFEDLKKKLFQMHGLLDQIDARAPQIAEEYRHRLLAKVHDLLNEVQIDESRLSTEIVLYADKICTDEERVRLRNHFVTMQETLDTEGDIGRKLDFIAQEMNREANTILSKSNDMETTQIAIDLKTGIEKIREQIQNIE